VEWENRKIYWQNGTFVKKTETMRALQTASRGLQIVKL
jgi:hypothetical protein